MIKVGIWLPSANVAALATALVVTFAANVSNAQDEDPRDGFTSPYREIKLAAAEPGLMRSLETQEGDEVKTGQVVARLDHAVLKASLAVAKKQMESIGQLKSAEAEFKLRNERWQKLTLLQTRQHASAEEVSLAKTERDVAESRVLTAQEALAVKKLEFERIKAQLEQRFVRAPFTGLVTLIEKDIGEYVPATDPAVMTVVQLNPLLATFPLVPTDAKTIKKGNQVSVVFDEMQQVIKGTVSFISPVNDANSGQVRVKVEIPNPDYKLRSGAKCTLSIGDKVNQPRVTSKSSKFRSNRPASNVTIQPRK